MDVPARVSITEEADVMLKRLTQKHGPLMFHQSGGCCDGSAPMCYPAGEFRVGGQDVLLGHISDAVPVWMGAAQFEFWRHTQLTIDVVPGRGAGFSLESPEGVRFIVRSRVFSDKEAAILDNAPAPLLGSVDRSEII